MAIVAGVGGAIIDFEGVRKVDGIHLILNIVEHDFTVYNDFVLAFKHKKITALIYI